MEWTKLDDTALNNVSGGNNEEELLKKQVDDLYIEILQLDNTIKFLKQKLEQEKQK